MRTLAVSIIAFTLAGGLAACGDDEPSDTGSEESTTREETNGSDDFAAEAEAGCIEGAEAIREVNLELGYAQKDDDVIEYLGQLLEARQSTLTELEALEPPEELADAWDEYLEARQNLVDATQESIAAREDAEAGAVETAEAAILKSADEMESTGAKLGIDACAGVVPDDDVEAAQEVLLEYSTTTDPAVICEPGGIATEIFVEGGFGGVDPCLNEQQKLASEPDSLPEDIKVTKVSGVDDVVATFEYQEIGGSAEGVPLTAQIYNVDGDWLLYSVGTGG